MSGKYALVHAMVDGACAAVMLGFPGVDGGKMTEMILLYNLLAFSTQGLSGLLADCTRRGDLTARAGCLLVAIGVFLPLGPLGKGLLLGMGNSLFHAGAGEQVMRGSGGKAAPLGVFVAPGAVGLCIGGLFPALKWLFGTALAVFVFLPLVKPVRRAGQPTFAPPRAAAFGAGAMLLFCVFSRAFVGSVVSFPWRTGMAATLALAVFAAAGKALGGFLCDRLGPAMAGVCSIFPAAGLILFCTGSVPLSLMGQLLLNLSMPVTLWLMYRVTPGYPGFAFGLAAGALYPGTLLAALTPEGVAARGWITAGVFFFNTVFILCSVWMLRERKEPYETAKKDDRPAACRPNSPDLPTDRPGGCGGSWN